MTSKATRQGRQGGQAGRQLELLVARLERALAGTGVCIKSPDRISDRDTGEPREVDVSLRIQTGSTEVLVVIECRDRGRPQDVRWIEELAQKARSIGAHRMMGVSSQGFTKAAIIKARREQVELRDVRDLSAHSVMKWLRTTSPSMVFARKRITLQNWCVSHAPPCKDPCEVRELIKQRDKPIFQLGTGPAFSVGDIFWSNFDNIFALADRHVPVERSLPRNLIGSDEPVQGLHPLFDLTVDVYTDGLHLVQNGALIPVVALSLIVGLDTEYATMRVKDGQQYSASGEPDTIYAARYGVEHVGWMLPKVMELRVLPQQQRITLAAHTPDGTEVELMSAPFSALPDDV